MLPQLISWCINWQKWWMGWPCDFTGCCWQGAYICLTHGHNIYHSWHGLYFTKVHSNAIWQFVAVRSEDFRHDLVQGYVLHRDPTQGSEVQQRYTNHSFSLQYQVGWFWHLTLHSAIFFSSGFSGAVELLGGGSLQLDIFTERWVACLPAIGIHAMRVQSPSQTYATNIPHWHRDLCLIIVIAETLSFLWFANRRSEVAHDEEEEMVAILAAPPLMRLSSPASARVLWRRSGVQSTLVSPPRWPGGALLVPGGLVAVCALTGGEKKRCYGCLR